MDMARVDETVYVVSGLPRSGTSMMMRMLEAGGMSVLTDDLRAPDRDNPRGYYEFEPVKRLKDGDSSWIEQARGKAVKIVSALLEYLPGNYRYKIVFMERDMNEILASQRKMLEHLGKSGRSDEDETFMRLYRKHLDKVKTWLGFQSNMNVLYVNYNKLLANPPEVSAGVAVFLGVSLDLAGMSAVPDQQLYRQRASNV